MATAHVVSRGPACVPQGGRDLTVLHVMRVSMVLIVLFVCTRSFSSVFFFFLLFSSFFFFVCFLLLFVC